MYTVRVKKNEVLNEDSFILHLEKPEGFEFIAGQFVVLEGEVDGKPTRRSYSIASAPHEETIDIAVRVQNPGFFSPMLQALQEGDELRMLGPYGRFLLPESDVPLLFVAAGTGITPFTSFLGTLSQTNDSREVTLLYSNKTMNDVMYKEKLDTFENARIVHTLTRAEESDWDGRHGRIDANLLAEHLQDTTEVFICGSTPFVVSIQEMLVSLGIPKEQVHTEKFGNITA